MNNCQLFTFSGITGSVDVDEHRKFWTKMKMIQLEKTLLEQRFIAAILSLKILSSQRKRKRQRKQILSGGKEISLEQLKNNKLIQALILKHLLRSRP